MTDTATIVPSVTEHRVAAADGYPLAVTVYGAGEGGTVVLINSATAVPRRFYRHFAKYFRDYGWNAVTYDYRGIGDSKPRSLRGFGATMRDWALLDMSAMIAWVDRELSPGRLFAVGHSFGGQAMGLPENADRVDAMVGVSAQSGYWGVQGGREKTRVRIAVTVVIPVLSRLVGYFPWSWFASGADLPKCVALEWARWCRRPNYLLNDTTLPLERYEQFTAPILAYSIDDDDWGTQQAVDDMMRAYPHVTRRHIRAQDYGLERLEHTGFFRQGSEPIWQEVIAWLDNLQRQPE